ncbi:xyloglucan galactosyltransferase MUR3-like [Impatiens glandulifera]|uniref:xyloglucan galactosyltransferase MUR3-like n=1 Tax=Impatiens glandulifera TaxID=253017 RepID=UPI001FB0AFFD|nr:xyloglucan galactosyltransferase MUR3-like [Impatiens glandulifera]
MEMDRCDVLRLFELSSSSSMERGAGKNSRSNVILLAFLSSFIVLLLFYFHFVVLGGTTVDYQTQLQSISDDNNPQSIDQSSSSAFTDDLPTSPSVEFQSVSQQQQQTLATNQYLDDEQIPVTHPNVNVSASPVNRSTTRLLPEKPDKYAFMSALRSMENTSDSCGGRYIYVYDLPPRFNDDMLKDCKSLSLWTDMCKFTTNAGLGPPLENHEGVFSDTGWYATNQFAVDVIFNNRMKQYDCLTNDSSLAAAFFVPFYAGFDIARYLWGYYNISTRDAASRDLVDWLEKRPEWKIMGGKDHFLVAGRITWDFRRLTDDESAWGSKFLYLPAAKNMSTLVIESSPFNSNDFAIPYPTYFHPSKDSEIFAWKERMRHLDRKWLFSFAGAPRPGKLESIRDQLIEQCRSSNVGKLLECRSAEESKCHSPSSIMQMFQKSVFCLQPQGDSYTRRSAFDSMLAGCIPVFFHPGSAYAQYTWHLPKKFTKYSVFIPEDDIRKGTVSIEEKLSEFSREEVKMMREEVINLIPRLIYADPRSKLVKHKDAFDVSIEAIIEKVTKLRMDLVEGGGNRSKDEYPEELNWKYALLGDGDDDDQQPHYEWQTFFDNHKIDIDTSSWKSKQR